MPENIPFVTSLDGSEGDGDASIQRGTSDSEWLDNESAYQTNDSVLSPAEDDHADRPYSGGREGGRKSAFYDHKQEKILKQTDAKLFYQQQQGGSGWNSPIMRASTWGTTGGGVSRNVSRAASVRSFNSSYQHPHTHSHGQQYLGPAAGAVIGGAAGSRGMGASTTPVGLATMEEPGEHGGIQVPEFDPHNIVASAQDMAQSQFNVSSQEEVLPAPQGSYVESRCSWTYTLFIFLLSKSKSKSVTVFAPLK